MSPSARNEPVAPRLARVTEAAYFDRLNLLAQTHGDGLPRLLLDIARLDANIDRVASGLRGRALRIVVKSLPSIGLLGYIARRAGTCKFMSFHWPFLVQAVRAFPDGDFLLGKPMPAEALRAFFRQRLPGGFDAARQITWLVDDAARLAEHLDLARQTGVRLRVAFEIDIGMHRGGAPSLGALDAMFGVLRKRREHAVFAGFMGYDAHAAKAPWPRAPSDVVRRSNAVYREFLEHARAHHADLIDEPLLLNGAGSPTFALHDDDSPLNEASIGSAFVKPAGFDLPALGEYEPAAWIAAPVLKRLKGVAIPFLETMSALMRGHDTLFLYGGKWMAEPAWPKGLRASALYGPSSNQQFMSVPSSAQIRRGDHAVFRPVQSESVLLEFGDLLAFDADDRIRRWPVFTREVGP